MEDVTNHLNNIGKSREAVKLTVTLSLDELALIYMYTRDAILDDESDGRDTLNKLNSDAKAVLDRYTPQLD